MRFLVDPHNITDYERPVSGLRLVLLFWVAAAGKKATTAARSISSLLEEGSSRFLSDDPFEIVASYGDSLAEAMKRHGMGCHGAKSRCMLALASSGLDLRTCSVSDLESVVGIGPKTARCFVMHSRRGVRHAGLDTHVLRYMRDIGLDVPKSTPSGRKYAAVEEVFLRLADSSGMSVAEFDLDIWRRYSSRAKAK